MINQVQTSASTTMMEETLEFCVVAMHCCLTNWNLQRSIFWSSKSVDVSKGHASILSPLQTSYIPGQETKPFNFIIFDWLDFNTKSMGLRPVHNRGRIWAHLADLSGLIFKSKGPYVDFLTLPSLSELETSFLKIYKNITLFKS